MLIYPIQGIWHHLKTREACKEVFDNIKDRKVRASCFCGEDARSFDIQPSNVNTFLCYMLNNYGTGNLKIRVWTHN